jgi:aspartyl-tRNA(Asn)/glutamyl-tRNA(Gln) amidotransferase subunit A
MTDLTDLPLTQITLALQHGEVSARELTQAFLERIKMMEPALKAFITVTPETALEQADQADRALRKQRQEGYFSGSAYLGIPVAIKDVLVTKDIPSTAGSRILENFVPCYNATAVERLLKAGMIILGKTNTDEFAMGSSTENSAYQTSRNPWNTSRVPGGSSGGSAAAVAARMAPVALGTDTGGSVRQPAAFCGITGLKPTYGRVSRYGLIAFGSSLDCVGVLGRDAADIAGVFQIIAGHDSRDATSSRVPVEASELDRKTSLKGLRIGVPKEYFIDGIQAEIETAIQQALAELVGLGAAIREISLPHTAYAIPVYYLIAPAEASANLARFDGVRYGPREDSDSILEMFRKTRGALFGKEVKRRVMLGTYALSAGYYEAYYGKAQKVRTLIREDFENAFSEVDVIAAPVTPTTAFRIGAHQEDPLSMYLEDIFTTPANLAGIPGLAFPIGFDGANLPIGMQLMASHYQEKQLLQIAAAYQQTTDWHLKTLLGRSIPNGPR